MAAITDPHDRFFRASMQNEKVARRTPIHTRQNDAFPGIAVLSRFS